MAIQARDLNYELQEIQILSCTLSSPSQHKLEVTITRRNLKDTLQQSQLNKQVQFAIPHTYKAPPNMVQT